MLSYAHAAQSSIEAVPKSEHMYTHFVEKAMLISFWTSTQDQMRNVTKSMFDKRYEGCSKVPSRPW